MKNIRMINPPVYSGSTVLFDSYQDLLAISDGSYDGITYGTDRLPTQREFEQKLCALEGGFLTRAFPSGISAIVNTLMALTSSGDHILVVENVYGPTAQFCSRILAKYNVEFEVIPGNVGEDIENYIKANTRLIFLEAPGSNTFEIQDIEQVAAIAGSKGICTILDNTWATPLFLDPFNYGVDIVIQSVTKYISGHSDVLLGTVTTNEEYSKQVEAFYTTMELFAPSQDCYLALRGLHTLGVRLRQHERSALRLGEWLASHPLVDRVLHPALEEHPQHALWKKYFSGSSGLFGFTLKDDYSEEKVSLFLDKLKLFGIGFSWGGFKSLVTIGEYDRPFSKMIAGKKVIRLHVGLEDVDALQNDLEDGLKVFKNSFVKSESKARELRTV
ncbi:cystathionine beta-lyase [Desulfopila sp. IMCC35008]|uniref:cystathionine beta-lyase n=1 Tax=Desulfopila sp. IMCC35008 TaxID=2653858 RepID=UPI0013D53E8D|nr:cystathionine beta-lyase [Desulfopila sp. IMCC35008]